RDLPSSPTRRSSDLKLLRDAMEFCNLVGIGGLVGQVAGDHHELRLEAIDSGDEELEVSCLLREVGVLGIHPELRIGGLDEEPGRGSGRSNSPLPGRRRRSMLTKKRKGKKDDRKVFHWRALRIRILAHGSALPIAATFYCPHQAILADRGACRGSGNLARRRLHQL